MSYDGPNPLPVPAGGTGDASLTAYAVLAGGTTSTASVQSIASVGTNGQVLTSNGAGALPTFQNAAASGITTIDGDMGSATGSTVTFNANSNAGASVKFVASGSTVDLEVTGTSSHDTFIGLDAGTASTNGGNTGVGYLALNAINSSGSGNSAYGSGSMSALTSGASNTGFGVLTLNTITSGSYNTTIGYEAGSNYTSSESSNICIGNAGTAAESNVLRIGTQGTAHFQQNTCYIAGIAGVSVSNLNYVTINTSTGQLGSTATATPTFSINRQVFTSTGTYTPTSGMVYCDIICIGGGGAGGGAATTNSAQVSVGSGGGYGEYAVGVFSAATIGASQSVTIGAAGAPAAGTTGGTGGTTSVGSAPLISAIGGTGGTTAASAANVIVAGGLGGTGGTGGSYRTPGQAGSFGYGNAVTNASTMGGQGGGGQLGAGGLTQIAGYTAGNAGLGYGAGGGGGTNYTSGASSISGGAGTKGIVIITEYIT